jgi:hypothetical protein
MSAEEGASTRFYALSGLLGGVCFAMRALLVLPYIWRLADCVGDGEMWRRQKSQRRKRDTASSLYSLEQTNSSMKRQDRWSANY